MYFYFAQFHPDEENPEIYTGSFPDLPGCLTYGCGLREAMTHAMEALKGYLEVEIDSGAAIPLPSDINSAKAMCELENRELDICPHDGTIYLLVPAEPHDAPE